MLLFFVPSDKVSEDPKPVPRKSSKKYGKAINISWSFILILHLDLWAMKILHFIAVTEDGKYVFVHKIVIENGQKKTSGARCKMFEG